jgi:hypothetical protein
LHCWRSRASSPHQPPFCALAAALLRAGNKLLARALIMVLGQLTNYYLRENLGLAVPVACGDKFEPESPGLSKSEISGLADGNEHHSRACNV